jgi:hypothetical protein
VEELIQTLEAAGVLEEAGEQGKSLIAEARAVFAAPECGGVRMQAEGRSLLAGLTELIS